MRLGDIFLVLMIVLWRLLSNAENAEWSQWSACSVSCGVGVQRRDFLCKKQQCSRTETRLCEMNFCSVYNMTANNLEGLLQGGIRKTDLALINHNIKEQLVSSGIECALYCLRLLECRSINIRVQKDLANPANALNSLVCQMNNCTADSEPENLVAINGSTYYSFLSRQSRGTEEYFTNLSLTEGY